MPGLVQNVLALLGLGFLSALVPLVNIEVILAARGATADAGGLWTLAFAAALGQMGGKVVWYYLGANALSWGWVRKKVETPKALARLEKWRTRTQRRPVVTSVLVLASAASGFPPFAIVAVLAGQLRMRLVLFFVLGLAGRWVRFAAVLGGAEWIKHLVG
ncbi:MAG: VTT domain-containing protein [Nocardioidaceae bacterium]